MSTRKNSLPDVVVLAELLHRTSPDCRSLPVKPHERGLHRRADVNWATVLLALLEAWRDQSTAASSAVSEPLGLLTDGALALDHRSE